MTLSRLGEVLASDSGGLSVLLYEVLSASASRTLSGTALVVGGDARWRSSSPVDSLSERGKSSGECKEVEEGTEDDRDKVGKGGETDEVDSDNGTGEGIEGRWGELGGLGIGGEGSLG